MNRRHLLGLRVISWGTCAFLAAPVVLILIASLTAEEFVTFATRRFTLRWYLEIGSHPEFVESLFTSLGVAGIVAPVATVLGGLAALALVRYDFPGKPGIVAFLLSPLLVPGIVTAIALLQFFVVLGVGVTPATLVVGHTILTMPYTVRLIAASLAGTNADLERAALNLGASAAQAFVYVTLPAIRPGLIGGLVLAFLISFDDVTVSLFLSTPTLVTLPVRIYTYIDQATSPVINAVSSVMIVISLLGVVLVDRFFGLKRAFGTAGEQSPAGGA